MFANATLAWEILAIIWINILLSGDNAVLIALACRKLPENRRRLGVILGATGGVVLRIAFTLVIVQAMGVPFIKIAGGALLLYVAAKLPIDRGEQRSVEAKPDLFSAVAAIIAADAIMSLDNVIAIAAAAHGSMRLIVFGLALSAPIVMFGADVLLRLFERFPLLTWIGAAILGWIAGELCAGDPFWTMKGAAPGSINLPFAVAGAAIVLASALLLQLWGRRREEV